MRRLIWVFEERSCQMVPCTGYRFLVIYWYTCLLEHYALSENYDYIIYGHIGAETEIPKWRMQALIIGSWTCWHYGNNTERQFPSVRERRAFLYVRMNWALSQGYLFLLPVNNKWNGQIVYTRSPISTLVVHSLIIPNLIPRLSYWLLIV